MRAFVDVALASSIPVSEPEVFLDAMVRDLSQTRYPTYESLRGYMRGSAAAVGLMMAHVFGVERTPASVEGAIALGEAMQMTNFLRDIGDDAQRGRIYLPQEDLDRFHVYEDEILSGTRSNNFRDLMAFEIDRTRTLYSKSDSAIANLPGEFRKGVRVARILYSRILDRIERNDFDVFATRVRTSRMEKLSVAAKVFSGLA
jgi:phytoene synthase